LHYIILVFYLFLKEIFIIFYLYSYWSIKLFCVRTFDYFIFHIRCYSMWHCLRWDQDFDLMFDKLWKYSFEWHYIYADLKRPLEIEFCFDCIRSLNDSSKFAKINLMSQIYLICLEVDLRSNLELPSKFICHNMRLLL
jgi:hypothetical protein